jgi:hypothetical protein
LWFPLINLQELSAKVAKITEFGKCNKRREILERKRIEKTNIIRKAPTTICCGGFWLSVTK